MLTKDQTLGTRGAMRRFQDRSCFQVLNPSRPSALAFEVHQPLAGYQEEVQPHGCARECNGIASVLCTWINILLVFVPLGIYSHMQEWNLGCAWDTVHGDTNFFSSTDSSRFLNRLKMSHGCSTGYPRITVDHSLIAF